MDFDEKLNEIYVQPELPKQLSDKYQVLSCLKHSKKRIYLIEDISSGEKYILKCADGTYAVLLKKEYSTLKRVSDEGCCPRIFSYCEEGETVYLVREYVSGETVQEKVEKQQLTMSETFDIIKKVCIALNKLHSLDPPVIMRDIKPENIVIRGNECIFIDFDAAREWHEEESSDTMYIGTRSTAAPEQFGYSQTDVRTDIYAVGMLMTYMLTGGYEVSAITDKKARRIAKKCTSFSPDKRYKSAEAVCSALKSKKPYYIAAAAGSAALLAAGCFAIIAAVSPVESSYAMSPTNNFTFTKQANSLSDPMISSALDCVDSQSAGIVRAGRTKRQMIEFLLSDSQYAVFGGDDWPCTTTDDERFFIGYVSDDGLEELDGTSVLKLDSNSSASMSTGWYVSGAVYTEEVSLESYRVYVDGDAGEYDADTVAGFFRKYLQAGEHLRIDETRSMAFVSCDDSGFYYIEYGSDDNSDHHLRFRYYTFEDFVNYLNALNRQFWYYEIDQSLNQ